MKATPKASSKVDMTKPVSIRLTMILVGLAAVYVASVTVWQSATTIWSLGFLPTMAIGFLTQLINLIIKAGARRILTVLLVTAVLFGLANIFCLMLAIRIDSFVIFSAPYGYTAIFAGPAVAMFLGFVLASLYKNFDEIAFIGYAIQIASTGYGHYWIIEQISASV